MRRQAVDEAVTLLRSARFEIVRGLLAAVADHLVFDRLDLVERTQAGPLDRGDMDEHVSAGVLLLNQAITHRQDEPLHCASSPRGLPGCTKLIAAARPSCDSSVLAIIVIEFN